MTSGNYVSTGASCFNPPPETDEQLEQQCQNKFTIDGFEDVGDGQLCYEMTEEETDCPSL